MKLNIFKSLAVVALLALLTVGVSEPVYAQKAKKEKDVIELPENYFKVIETLGKYFNNNISERSCSIIWFANFSCIFGFSTPRSDLA